MLNLFPLTSRLLWRDWRAGEWWAIILALLLASASLTALHFYTDRLERALNQQAATLLGGNLVVSSSMPLPVTWKHEAQALHLRTTEIWSYPSVIVANQQLHLTNIYAVSQHYPLFQSKEARPAAGAVWVEERLLSLAGIKLKDHIKIGASNFQVTNTLTLASEGLSTGWTIAPKVLMRLEDVLATQTVIPGSQVNYRLLLAGDAQNIQRYRLWIAPQLRPGQGLIDLDNQRIPLRNILQQAENYLHLLILVCFMMCGVVIAMSVQQYQRRHHAHIALWRCLGMRQNAIMTINILQLFIIALLAGLLGSLLGYMTHLALVNVFQDMLRMPLPSANWYPVLIGVATSVFLLFAFALPLICELPHISPIFLWRDEVNIEHKHQALYLSIALLVMLLFIFLFMGMNLSLLFYVDILLLSIGCLYIISLYLFKQLSKLLPYTQGSWRQGLNQIIHHPVTSSIQFIGFTLILMALMMLAFIRTQVINHWRLSLPQKTPNYFAANLAPTDVPQVEKFMRANHVIIDGMNPIIRGRLVALNNQPIIEAVPGEARNNNALHRELNLSWMRHFPSDNKIVDGKPWATQDSGQALVSVEKDLADALHLKLGDELTFQVGEKFVTARIHSLRTLSWSSFHPNFFMIFPPGILDDFPTTYVTSFYLPANQGHLLNHLITQFPNITIIDMASILSQLQFMIENTSRAIEYLFMFIVAVGMLIFIVSFQATSDERYRMQGLLRILGANRRYIYKMVFAEFLILGLLIVSFAVLFAKLLSYFILYKVFNL